jgi:hypothetical protein
MGSLSWARSLSAAVLVAVCGTTQARAADVPDGVDRDAVRQQVRESSPTSAELHGKSLASAASRLLRCFDVGAIYCLGIGFTGTQPSLARIKADLDADSGDRQGGALGVTAFVSQRTALSDADRVDAELAEIDEAFDGAAKARAVAASLDAPPAPETLPSNYIMYGYQTRQVKSYWCGPASFQSIDWADDKVRDTQAGWAADLGTTTGGTSLSSMVKLTNAKTDWDLKAGPYIVQSVEDWTAEQFMTVHRNHLGDAQPAPVIEHPMLLKQYFPYLKFSHSGHYTVGRGYSDNTDTISYFEVFNEADWNSRGNETWGIQAGIPAATLLAATKANASFQNIGL